LQNLRKAGILSTDNIVHLEIVFMPKKKKKEGKPEVHESLEGFDIKINEFGEIITTLKTDELNEFLNETVDDKKLREREAQKKSEEEE